VTIDRDLELTVRSDAARWYAYQEHRAAVVAVDTRAHARLALHEPGRCSLEDLRFARVLLGCRDDPVARLVSLPRRTATDFTDTDPRNGSPFPDEFLALGRYWLGGFTCEDGGRCAQVYLNRRSLERRIVSPEDNGNANALQADVDSPDLALKDTTRLVDVRSGGYRLTQGSNPDDPLVLSHKGRRRTLSECRNTCGLVTLGGGLVTWDDGKVRAYSLRLRKTFSWRVPFKSPSTGFVTGLVHTWTSVLITTAEPNSATSRRETLYAGGVPRRP
jgi:hypothetical protein